MKVTWLIPLLLLPVIANAQFYYPDHKDYGSPKDYGLTFDDVYFQSSDGTKLHAWHIQSKSKEKAGTIIHFHGNAQNISSHIRGVAWLADHGFDLFLFDYRGFGHSEGRPDQEGVFLDCVAAIKEAQKRSPAEANFIIYGQSLGAANAIAVIGEKKFPKIKGVIAEAPFYSYQSISRDKVNKFWGSFVGAVISDNKSPYLVIDNISPIPLLLAHGTGDRVIPFKHSQALFDKAKEPKEYWKIPNARHLGIFIKQNQRYRNRLVATLNGWIEQDDEEQRN